MTPVRKTHTQPFPKQPLLAAHALRRADAGLPSILDLPHAVRTRSGRSALMLALDILGVGAGDRVLVPTYHCPTMIAPIERLGAIPLFYPITVTGEPDLRSLVVPDGARVRAMLAAHFFGLPISLGPVVDFCRAHNIALIEDCAHCFFGVRDGAPVGATGDFAIASLPKFFPVLEGGILASSRRSLEVGLDAVTTKRELRAAWDIVDLSARHDRLGLLGSLVRTATGLRAKRGTPPTTFASTEENWSPETTRQEGLRDPLLTPARLTSVESWIVDHTDYAASVAQRRLNFRALARALSGIDGMRPLFTECAQGAAPYVMPLHVDAPERPYARMRALGLPVFRWDRLWPGTTSSSTDAGTLWSRSVIQIACHQSLSDAETLAVSEAVRECVREA